MNFCRQPGVTSAPMKQCGQPVCRVLCWEALLKCLSSGAVQKYKSPVPFPTMLIPPLPIFMQFLHREDKNIYYSYSSKGSSERCYTVITDCIFVSSVKNKVAGT